MSLVLARYEDGSWIKWVDGTVTSSPRLLARYLAKPLQETAKVTPDGPVRRCADYLSDPWAFVATVQEIYPPGGGVRFTMRDMPALG